MTETSSQVTETPIRVGCAGWRMPTLEQREAGVTHLQRYSQVFSAVEINSSFYQPHRRATYAKWATSVDPDFAFSVKLPKAITHLGRLADVESPVSQFWEAVAGLGAKLKCILVQLPPKLGRHPSVDERFFERLRRDTHVDIVCEARNPEWFDERTDALLASYSIGRVIADPRLDPREIACTGDPPVTYVRLHGSPKVYYSEYGRAALEYWRRFLLVRQEAGHRCWCIFDNTAAGHALTNAYELRRNLDGALSCEISGDPRQASDAIVAQRPSRAPSRR
jgi:uncharacterized protein YecE (DUF72 family)